MKKVDLTIIVKDLPENLVGQIKDRLESSIKSILQEYGEDIKSKSESKK